MSRKRTMYQKTTRDNNANGATEKYITYSCEFLSLQTLELDLSRSKVETEAFELIAETLQGLHALKSLAVSVENMKITPRNVVNLASCLAGHDRLEELHLNLNFNEQPLCLIQPLEKDRSFMDSL